MTTVGDSPEGFERLAEALEAIDFELQRPGAEAKRRGAMKIRAVRENRTVPEVLAMPERCMEIDRAVIRPTEEVPLEEAAGRVMGDYLYLYPPGVPMLVPGEVIQMKHIERVKNYLNQGLEVHGGYSKESGNVKVILHHG